MSDDPIWDALRNGANEEMTVTFTGDYGTAPVIGTSPTTVTFYPGWSRWQRFWAFIRRHKLLTSVTILSAQISKIHYGEDGIASVEITSQNALDERNGT